MSQVTVRNHDSGAATARRYGKHPIVPTVDVFESPDDVLVIADLPGVPGDAVDVRVENDTLTIETKRPASDEAAPALSREFEDENYARTFRIPAGIDTAQITAESRQGTLVVRLPKAAAAKPRKIAVKAS